MIDLHNHTYYSDGKFSPAEVVHFAAEIGISTLAISDHDNARGAREALPLAKAAGIELIPAIELSTQWPEAHIPASDADVDLLGYFIDLEDPAFSAFEQAQLDCLHRRTGECCAWLRAHGTQITLEEVFAENPRYAGPLQLIQALQHKGIGDSFDEAFPLGADAWAATSPLWCHISEGIRQIHAAGGIAVLAHPSVCIPEGQPLDRTYTAQLVDMGLDGLEVFHDRVDAETRARLQSFAREFGLVTSGGSDMHGWYEGVRRFGSQPVTEAMVQAIRDRAGLYSKRNDLTR